MTDTSTPVTKEQVEEIQEYWDTNGHDLSTWTAYERVATRHVTTLLTYIDQLEQEIEQHKGVIAALDDGIEQAQEQSLRILNEAYNDTR